MSAAQVQPAAHADPASKQHKKQNPIGSWFVKKFGRRNSEAGSSIPSATYPSDQKPSKIKEPRNRRTSHLANTTNPPSNASPARTLDGLPSFAADGAQGLASTLTVPASPSAANFGTLPPQLASLPQQEPLGTLGFTPNHELGPASASRLASPAIPAHALPSHQLDPAIPATGLAPPASDMTTPRAPHTALALAPHLVPSADYAASSTANNPNDLGTNADDDDDDRRSSSDSDVSSRDGFDRHSIGNRTMDTGKSRASTKPTTLMSLDTREAHFLPTAHIAQARQSDGSSSTQATSTGTSTAGATAVQFAPPPPTRIGNGTRAYSAINDETGSFVNVPSLSRHHPSNNPQPLAMPPDNASVLTLASSTAAHSYAGAASSRSYGHAHASSLGGARSIGGSLMGDRRNSSDTYASLMALPPLSRRGSDSSSRTRESVAASATGQSSAQAMYPAAYVGGPGAPSDRISIHRTPSQRTVATQRSIPLSGTASNPALNTYNGSSRFDAALVAMGTAAAAVATTASDEATKDAQATLPPPQRQLDDEKAPAEAAANEASKEASEGPVRAAGGEEGQDATELLEAQASNIAASEHDDNKAGSPSFFSSSAPPVDDDDKLHLPGGPAISP
ncbi:hypothetical protein ACQY0O_005462 [Thecaphora frezii]